MKVSGYKKTSIELDDDQLDEIVAKHIYTTFWDNFDLINTNEEAGHFCFMYKYFSGRDLGLLNER